MKVFRTHCALRLGDNLGHLHFMRAMAKAYPSHRFIHYAHLCYVHQLSEVVCDLPNLQICDLESASDGVSDYWKMRPRFYDSIDAWKNASGFWENHVLKNSWADFQLVLCDRLARCMGLQNPITAREQLLFDYPALQGYDAFGKFDCLVINSRPMSGQMPGFDPGQMELLVAELARLCSVITTAPTFSAVPCTMNEQMTITQIGALSRFCRFIVAVSTGSSWTTWNVFNAGTIEFRVVLIDHETVNITPNTEHANTVEAARRILQARGAI